MVKSAYAITRAEKTKQLQIIDKENKIDSAALYIYHLMAVSRWKLKIWLVSFDNIDHLHSKNQNHF